MPTDLEKEAAKEAVKEALKEWLDEKFMEFGKWSLGALAAAGLAALVWLILASAGWHR